VHLFAAVPAPRAPAARPVRPLRGPALGPEQLAYYRLERKPLMPSVRQLEGLV
jgi:hypothetical protein